MSLKEVINSLIGVTSARPKQLYQQIQLTADGTNRSFVMPIDGWVSLIGQENIPNTYMSNFVWSDAGQDGPTASVSVQAAPGYTSQSLGFFKKGQSVNYNIQGYQQALAKIFSLIGGGLSSILKAIGGGLCQLSHLNRLFNRFSSSQARKQCRANQTSTSVVCHSQVSGVNFTRPFPTAISSCLGFISKQLKSPTSQSTFELSQLQKSLLEFSFQCQKAIRSTFTANTREQEVCSLSSLRQSAQANLCLQGGAL